MVYIGLYDSVGGDIIKKVIDLSGKKIDKLFVIKEEKTIINKYGKKEILWTCNCDCGNKNVKKYGSYLRTKGIYHNCGCEKKTRKGQRTSYKIGETYENVEGDTYKIIGYTDDSTRREIEFESGYKCTIMVSELRNGKVRDFNRNTYYDVACIGMKYGTNHPLYYRWFNMIGRCYNKEHCQYKSYGAKGIYVSDELLNFKNYVDIVSKLDNYDCLIHNPKEWDIDKDLKCGEEKFYSKDTLSIIPKKENMKLSYEKNIIPVTMYSEDMTPIRSFDSISEAERITGFHRGNIARSVREGYKCNGYYWRKRVC